MKLINVNGENYGFIWGTAAFLRTQDLLNLSLLDIQFGIGEDRIFFNLAYSALSLWCKKNNKGTPFDDVEDFYMHADNFNESDITGILEDYMNSTYTGKTMRKYYEEKGVIFNGTETKKDVKKKKSTPQKSSSISSVGDTTPSE